MYSDRMGLGTVKKKKKLISVNVVAKSKLPCETCSTKLNTHILKRNKFRNPKANFNNLAYIFPYALLPLKTMWTLSVYFAHFTLSLFLFIFCVWNIQRANKNFFLTLFHSSHSMNCSGVDIFFFFLSNSFSRCYRIEAKIISMP